MAHGKVDALIPATSAQVFDLIHDYPRRLEWDTLLQAAYLDDGFTEPGKGVTSVCVGRPALGSIALKTVYVTFDRPRVAAVKMINSPPFFGAWAASIRHEDVDEHHSRVTYTYTFTPRPAWLRFILEPIMQRVFLWETRKRLQALHAYFAARQAAQQSARPEGI